MKVDAELLEQQIRDATANYEERRQHNKRISRSVLILCASISAITTVLIGLSAAVADPYGRILGMIALGTSASVTVIGAWDGLFNHKKLWVLYTEHWIAMQDLLMDLEHAKKSGGDDATYSRLYDRLKGIRASLDTKWQAMKLEDFTNAQQGGGGQPATRP